VQFLADHREVGVAFCLRGHAKVRLLDTVARDATREEAGAGGAAELVCIVVVTYDAAFGQCINRGGLDLVVVAVEAEPVPAEVCASPLRVRAGSVELVGSSAAHC